jgi:pimeloyl-ACP methyl ester carboxylesterase
MVAHPQLFKVILKENKNAQKVLFFLSSYKAPWRIYSLAISRLRHNGYEVVVYDVNDYMLDNDEPQVLIQAVRAINADINRRIAHYEAQGIITFDAIGNSLGSFLLFNYSIQYPLRKIVLNIGGYMSSVIFGSKDKRIQITRKKYEAKGFNQQSLQKTWAEIDAPHSGKYIKAAQTLYFTSLHDKFVTNEVAAEVEHDIASSDTKFTVYRNNRLGHSGAVLKNVHSRVVSDFLLD